MSGELGKASLDLEANLAPFAKNMKAAKGDADDFQHALDSLAAVSKIAEEAIQRVKMKPGQSAESRASAQEILSGVRGVSEEARIAARELDNVKLDQAQAVESKVAAQEISSGLNEVSRNADQAKRKLAEVSLASRNPGAGVGPFGSGFGRIGALGAAIGAGTLATPAAGPAALGLLAAIPALSAAGVGSLGTLALAFDGVGKAISGDKKAFDGLVPSAQKFTLLVRSLDGEFNKLKETAAASLFPGLTAALHSALSPGTLSAVTTAIREFGNAIGAAGAAWGRYFGSAEFQSIFIPMMSAGAHDLTLMSAAALSLFDAFGVLGRAAIPFTNWLLTTIAHGSQFVDTWLHAKDATGQLGHALDEARTSLQLVAGLVASLLRVVGALGQALYPVSQIFLKDLTDGLNALAAIIRRNQDGIREIVGGALTALASTIRTLAPIVSALAHGLNDVVHAMGGWKTAFEIIIGGFLAAKFATLVGGVAKFGQSLLIARGEALSLTSALGLIPAVVVTTMIIYEERKKIGNAVKDVFGPDPSTSSSDLLPVQNAAGTWVNPITGVPVPDQAYWRKHPNVNAAPPGGADRSNHPQAAAASQRAFIAAAASRYGLDPNAVLGVASNEGLSGGIGDNGHAFGPFQLNDAGGVITGMFPGKSQAQIQAWAWSPAGINWALKHMAASGAKGLTGAAAVDAIVHGFERPKDPTADLAAGYKAVGASPFGATPAWSKNTGPKPTMPTGANLLPSALRDALQKAKDMATTTQGATAAHWLQVEVADLDKARADLETQLKGASGKKKVAIQQELRSIDGQIASVNRQITTNLHAQAQTIKATFASKISTAKANIATAVSALTQSLDAALGTKFFQGTQTPLEAQLAEMQAADTAQSLQDALAQAVASGDPAQIAAAQRAITENNLAIAAAAERAKADKDYAAAEKDLNEQITVWARGIANGTTNLSDLNGIVGAFGLSLTDGGVIDDFAALGSAVQDLAAILIAESTALGGIGDNKDAAAAAARAAALNIPVGAPTLIPGTNINFAGFVAASMARNLIPSLDVGGTVTQDGIAMVHRGEEFSGVGKKLGGDGVTLQVGPVYGAIDQATARLWAATLKTELDRVIQL